MKELTFYNNLFTNNVSTRKAYGVSLTKDDSFGVNEQVLIKLKVSSHTTRDFGSARIDWITAKRLKDIGSDDLRSFSILTDGIDDYIRRIDSDIAPDPDQVVFFYGLTIIATRDVGHALPKVVYGDAARLYADGGSRGNPGPSASGYVILGADGEVLDERGIYLGITTNNQAEYQALKSGLDAALVLGIRDVHVYMDSLLVVNQILGIFKIKNRDLWPIHDSIKELAKLFRSISFTHVPRELNKAADRMVNKALDAALKSD
jgi:ribonuclease HI